jgi:hypothetical protein
MTTAAVLPPWLCKTGRHRDISFSMSTRNFAADVSCASKSWKSPGRPRLELSLLLPASTVISPRLISLLTSQGAFSIIDSYLELAGGGEKISGFRADRYNWRDLGTVESLRQATAEFEAQR